jgi:hypothetical protein
LLAPVWPGAVHARRHFIRPATHQIKIEQSFVLDFSKKLPRERRASRVTALKNVACDSTCVCEKAVASEPKNLSGYRI